ncbi:MAG: SCO family protein [Anaerolineales bacterium]|nr:SCO family protein [Anaerolineales bacterium]MCB8950568.1 SCO family protein [Ardenticatenales bacterium]
MSIADYPLDADHQPDPVRPASRRFLWVVYALIGLFVIGSLAFATFRPILVLPRIGLAPGFSLQDETGQRFTSEDLRGQIAVYNFTYTNCVSPCPDTDAVMQGVQARLGEVDTGGIPVTLVTVSFDPRRDTPERLREYAARLRGEDENWHFLTGAPDRLKWMIGGGFSVFYDARDDGTFTFDPAFMLVDGTGILRAEYRTATPEVDRVLRDVGLVAQEANKSKGANRAAYEAAHLFLCYPR